MENSPENGGAVESTTPSRSKSWRCSFRTLGRMVSHFSQPKSAIPTKGEAPMETKSAPIAAVRPVPRPEAPDKPKLYLLYGRLTTLLELVVHAVFKRWEGTKYAFARGMPFSIAEMLTYRRLAGEIRRAGLRNTLRLPDLELDGEADMETSADDASDDASDEASGDEAVAVGANRRNRRGERRAIDDLLAWSLLPPVEGSDAEMVDDDDDEPAPPASVNGQPWCPSTMAAVRPERRKLPRRKLSAYMVDGQPTTSVELAVYEIIAHWGHIKRMYLSSVMEPVPSGEMPFTMEDVPTLQRMIDLARRNPPALNGDPAGTATHSEPLEITLQRLCGQN